nr:Gag-Pol polyprotein [Tanacetum cinerariifolium]
MEFRHFAKECRIPTRTKDHTYHKEKTLVCKQAKKGFPLQVEQADWLEDMDEEIDEQELEAHYSYMAKIQEDHDNIIPDSSNMCVNANQDDQNVEECNDEQLKECKSTLEETGRTLEESNSTRDSCLIALQNKEIELEKYKTYNNRTLEYDKLKPPKGSTYNGRPTFANSTYLKKAQSEKPCLYEIPYDHSDLANIFAPDREETLTLEQENRSKLNKDLVKPYDYTKQNSLLSHLNFNSINFLLKKDIVNGLPKLKFAKDQLCSSCELGKAKRSTFKTKIILSSKGRLNLLHMDLCGPMRIEGINEKKYILASDYDNSSLAPQLQKTSDHNRLELRTHDHSNEPSSSTLVPNVSPLADTNAPSLQELDFLFSPLFEEYFTASNQRLGGFQPERLAQVLW